MSYWTNSTARMSNRTLETFTRGGKRLPGDQTHEKKSITCQNFFSVKSPKSLLTTSQQFKTKQLEFEPIFLRIILLFDVFVHFGNFCCKHGLSLWLSSFYLFIYFYHPAYFCCYGSSSWQTHAQVSFCASVRFCSLNTLFLSLSLPAQPTISQTRVFPAQSENKEHQEPPSKFTPGSSVSPPPSYNSPLPCDQDGLVARQLQHRRREKNWSVGAQGSLSQALHISLRACECVHVGVRVCVCEWMRECVDERERETKRE